MLTEIQIKNFAIIDRLAVSFQPGFNVLTGETGAGKSIIIDAVGLLLGDRARPELIRSGEDEATVEAVVDIVCQQVILGIIFHEQPVPVKLGPVFPDTGTFIPDLHL